MSYSELLLFKRYPELVENIPWLSLGSFPTAVQKLTILEQNLEYDGIWIKRDDQTGELYGGNKVRKLEFIIADVLRRKKQWILTFGGLGSNHCLATALYGREHGLKTVLCLIDQPLTEHTQEQLLRFDYLGAKISYARNTTGAVLKGVWQLASKWGVYLLGPGGSSEFGNLGYVEAGLELANQIDNGLLPKPGHVYVPIGTMGTYCGLKIGFELADLDIDLVGVRVTERSMTNEKKAAKLVNKTAKMLQSFSDDIPEIELAPADIHIDHDFAGPSYGAVTDEGLEAQQLLSETEGIHLETTYTGKAFAGMLDHIRSKKLSGEPVLYWHTYNSVDLRDMVRKHHDFTHLPRAFHKFFKENLISYI
ncbi:MAG: pyridoxal-phosphate dependent enzyme [Candidatus Thorarchaeota archaeon]|nr:MAG: pyridoxal-phosphate dependent enzyme [Candidatus Thorarchaeota archaeon]